MRDFVKVRRRRQRRHHRPPRIRRRARRQRLSRTAPAGADAAALAPVGAARAIAGPGIAPIQCVGIDLRQSGPGIGAAPRQGRLSLAGDPQVLAVSPRSAREERGRYGGAALRHRARRPADRSEHRQIERNSGARSRPAGQPARGGALSAAAAGNSRRPVVFVQPIAAKRRGRQRALRRSPAPAPGARPAASPPCGRSSDGRSRRSRRRRRP